MPFRVKIALLLILILVLFAANLISQSGTSTAILGLFKPSRGSAGWDTAVNSNMDKLEAAIAKKPYIDLVRDCGAVGDATGTSGVGTDDSVAVQTCLKTYPSATFIVPQGKVIRIATPVATFGTLRVGLILSGVGARIIGANATSWNTVANKPSTLFFDNPGMAGILIANQTQSYGGLPAGYQGCGGCGIENLFILGVEPWYPTALYNILPAVGNTGWNFGGKTTGTSLADGIIVGANFVHISHVQIENMGRMGVYLDGHSVGTGVAGACTSSDPPTTSQNNCMFADNFIGFDIIATNNRGSGFFNRGSDSNASSCTNCVGYFNQLFAVEDYSFLGSQWNSPQATGNHANAATGVASKTISNISNTGNVTTVQTSTAHGLAVGNAVKISGTTNYNTPACNAINCTVWVATVPDSTHFTYAQTSPIATETSGTVTYATANEIFASAGNDANIGGAYRADGGALHSVWVNPYSEANNGGVCRFSGRQIIIGGDLGCTIDWSSAYAPTWLNASNGTMNFPYGYWQGRDTSGTVLDAQLTLGNKGCTGDPCPILGLFNTDATSAPAGSKGALYLTLTNSTLSATSSRWCFHFTSSTCNASYNNAVMWLEYGGSRNGGANTNVDAMAGFPHGWMGGYAAGTSNELWHGWNTDAIANAPTDFTQNRGSTIDNNGAASPGFAQWVNVSAGTPGTYKAANPIADDTTGTSWTFPTVNVTTSFLPTAVNTVDIGSASKPFRNFYLGTAATNNFVMTPAATAAARTVTINDPGANATMRLEISGTASAVDLASVNSGACTADSADLTVTGAAVGDAVIVTTSTALEAGTWLIGRVTASNTTRYQFCNLSGSPVDRASANYTVRVLK